MTSTSYSCGCRRGRRVIGFIDRPNDSVAGHRLVAGSPAGNHRGGEPVAISYPELGAVVKEIARGLIALGIDAGDRVAILGSTAADWTLADYGALCAGAVLAPIYHTNSPHECQYVLGHSEARLVFCENATQAAKIAKVREQLPNLEHIVLFSGEAEDAITVAQLRKLQGYFKDPTATGEMINPEGWLCSGDLGSISQDGYLTITGRKKDLIITSGGKNITPVNIESALRDSRYITEAVVYVDNRPYLVAMLTLDQDEAVKLAAKLGIATDPTTIAHDPGVRAEIQKDVDAVNEKLARIEQVKRFAILERDLSQAEGELTPTLKVKRALVDQKYAEVFAGLYQEGGQS